LLEEDLGALELGAVLGTTIRTGEGLHEVERHEGRFDFGFKKVCHGEAIGEKGPITEDNLGRWGGDRRLHVPIGFGPKGLALNVVVELLEKLIANSTASAGAGASAGGGVDSVHLGALATFNDLQATHCLEDVVLHFLQSSTNSQAMN